jgi:hypothetical protein
MRLFAKAKRPLHHLVQNSTKSLCQPSVSVPCGLFEFADFALFWVHFGDNLVTVERFWPLAHMTVTHSHLSSF